MADHLKSVVTTAYGTTIELGKKHWIVHYKSGKQDKKLKFDWTKIPVKWQPFWKEICRSLIDTGSEAQSNSILYALGYFHEWLEEKAYAKNNFILNEVEVALFYEWLIHKPIINHGKEGNLSNKSAENIMYALISGFKAALNLEKKEVSQELIDTINSFCKTRLIRNRNQDAYKKAKDILSTEQQELLQQVFLQQKLMAEEMMQYNGDLPLGFVKETIDRKNNGTIKLPVRKVDLLVVTACWLALHHGVRASEFASLTVDDFVENQINGRYQLLCRAPQKPDRWVDVHHPSTVSLLKLYIEWTEFARTELNTNMLAADIVCVRQKFETKIINNKALNSRIELFLKRFNLNNDENSMTISLTNLRRTFGANYASFTQNREATRIAMGHEDLSTTEKHYLTQNLRDLSRNVSESLKNYAYTLTLSYKKPVVDLEEELPEIASVLQSEPERDIDYGICTVPKTTAELKDSCARAAHCLECQFLVSEVNKRQNYIDERDEYLKLAEEEEDERIKQSRLRRATELEAHLLLMDEALERFKLVHEENTNAEQPVKRKKRKYK